MGKKNDFLEDIENELVLDFGTALQTGFSDLHSWLLQSRTVFLDDEIDALSVNNVIMRIQYLLSEDDELPVNLVVNSNGGSIEQAIVLASFLVHVSRQTTLRTICIGNADSAALLILSIGTFGERYVYPNSSALAHGAQGVASGGMQNFKGTIKPWTAHVDWCEEKFRTLLIDSMARDGGKKISKRRRNQLNLWYDEISIEDEYLSSERIIDLGAADCIEIVFPYQLYLNDLGEPDDSTNCI